MTSSDLDRVRKDLDVIQQALGAESFLVRANWKHALLNVLILVPLVLWSTVGPGTYMSLAIIVTLVALAAGGIGEGRAYRRERAEHPARWREWRRLMMVPLWGAPLVVLFGVWAISNGVPPRTMTGLVLAVAGGILVAMGCFAAIRRSYIPMGLAMIVCGLALPWYTDQQVGLGFALMFLVGELTSWAIAARQLRRAEQNHVTS
jgi:hypothetical protein